MPDATAYTRPVKLSVGGLRLLRRLATHANAHVKMERTYPLTPYYTVTYADGDRWTFATLDERDLADVAMVHAVSATVDTREEREGGWVDVRVWHLSEAGRQLLERKGVLVEAEEVPTLFPLPTRSHPRSSMDHST